MDENKLLTEVKIFKAKQGTSKFVEITQERSSRITYYQSFTVKKIKDMTPDDFYDYISNLWSMLIWGNKKYIVDKIVADNGFDNLKEQLIDLLYGKHLLINVGILFYPRLKD